MISDVLSLKSAELLHATLDRLRQAGLVQFVLSGGTAIAWHTAQATGTTRERPLNDVDLVVANLSSIPALLGESFLLWHVHSDALPGRMLVQVLDPSTALRVDIFGAYGFTLTRSLTVPFGPTNVQVASRGDVIARLTALLLDLGLGEAVPPKHARDFSALIDHITPTEIEPAWRDHRRRKHPKRFEDAREAVSELIAKHADLLIDTGSPYEQVPCPRCREHPTLKLASSKEVAAVRLLQKS